jgi:hypothetical protein
MRMKATAPHDAMIVAAPRSTDVMSMKIFNRLALFAAARS